MTELKIATARMVRSRPPTISAPKRFDSDRLLLRTAIQKENEATPRFELGNGAFAEPCLTTWLRRRLVWSGWRESNPRINLGKVAGYHYITPAARSEALR